MRAFLLITNRRIPPIQDFAYRNLHRNPYVHIFSWYWYTFEWEDQPMRTTLVIPDAVLHRAKQAARDGSVTLSEWLTEAAIIRLAKKRKIARAKMPYRIRTVSMGEPKVDLSDRDAVFRTMEE
jgi:hypothetical protein